MIDPDQLANWRRYTKLHTQLYPVPDRGAAHVPADRAAADAPPGAGATRATRAPPRADDEFLLGPDLLVAPVLDQGATERTAYLPGGRWIDLWRSATYREGSGGLALGGAVVFGGRRQVTVPAPLDGAAAVRARGRGAAAAAAARRHARRLRRPRPRPATPCATPATGCGCSPSRAASGSRASARGRSCARVESAGRWTLEVAGDRTPQLSDPGLAGDASRSVPALLGRASTGASCPPRRWSYDRRTRRARRPLRRP